MGPREEGVEKFWTENGFKNADVGWVFRSSWHNHFHLWVKKAWDDLIIYDGRVISGHWPGYCPGSRLILATFSLPHWLVPRYFFQHTKGLPLKLADEDRLCCSFLLFLSSLLFWPLLFWLSLSAWRLRSSEALTLWLMRCSRHCQASRIACWTGWREDLAIGGDVKIPTNVV